MLKRVLICPGAQKSGTTWLFQQLKDHPQIAPSYKKELNFFTPPAKSGSYSDQFMTTGVADEVLLDVSPRYSVSEATPAAIASACPDAKIIFLLREPVARAISQYRMATRLGNIKGLSLIEAFRANAQTIRRRGCYSAILVEYERFFPLGPQMLIRHFSEIVDDPATLVSEICTFAGIEPFADPALLTREFAKGIGVPTELDDVVRGELEEFYRPYNTELMNRYGIRL